MSRLLALALVATSLAGCKSYPKTDPIYGNQRIPSQRTGGLGAVVPRDGTPPPQYYEPGSGSGGNNVPAAPGAGSDPLAPPGGFGFQGQPSSSRTVVPDSGSSGWNRPGAAPSDFGNSSASGGLGAGIPARTGPDDFTRRGPDNSGYGTSRYENPPADAGAPRSNFAPPPPSSGSGASPFPAARDGNYPPPPSGADAWRSDAPYRSTSYEGGASQEISPARSRGEVVDIMDLPSRGALHGNGNASPGDVRQAGYAAYAAPRAADDAHLADGAAQPGEEGPYGYDRDYRWLKGRLEYSPTSRRWKLRYIPITGRAGTGQTDQYGGSVMLEDAPALQEMRRGDAVLIEGQIVGNGEASSFAPLYRAERLSRLP